MKEQVEAIADQVAETFEEGIDELGDKLQEGLEDCADHLPEFSSELDDAGDFEALPDGLEDCGEHLPEFSKDLGGMSDFPEKEVGGVVGNEKIAKSEVLDTVPAKDEGDKNNIDEKAISQIEKNKPVTIERDPRRGKESLGEHFVEGTDRLKPNNTYTDINEYTYATDSQGRIIKVEGDLVLQPGTRNLDAQRKVGEEDRKSGDQGGHLIGDRFNGSGDADNLVAMDGNINQGAYKKLENVWAKALEEEKSVSVKIEPIYDGDSKRPVAFKISYTIDGEKFSSTLENVSAKDI